jgi:hypothetical protein
MGENQVYADSFSLNFSTIEFALHSPASTPAHHRDLYSRLEQHTRFRLSQLGTVIWFATCLKTGEERVLKEFSFANALEFWRELPDPAWQNPTLSGVVSGHVRGLSSARASAFDKLLSGEMKEEVRRAGPSKHPSFLPQFSSYSFELEALICQFAQLYGCRRLVQARRWGAIQLPSAPEPRFVLEMEPLEEWTMPPVNDVFLILHELLEMMMAVSQLHGMLIPLRCYPPELVRDLDKARQLEAAHPYHYDLAPDQFMVRRTFNGTYEERELVLIDFNSARMGATELSNFSWGMVPGKDYFQPPERRSDLESRKSLPSFATNPACDLYSLLVIALLLLARRSPDESEISQLPGWETLPSFYQWLGTRDTQLQFQDRLQSLLPHNSQHRMLQPLLELMSHTLILDPRERMELLTSYHPLQWKGTSDWMLVPRAMNWLARQCAQRHFQVGWREPTLRLQEGQQGLSLSDWLVPEQCQFHGGHMERDRVPLPLFSREEVLFLQMDGRTPFVQKGRVLTNQPGETTIVACFAGCIDFDHPLRVLIEKAPSTARELPLQARASAPSQSWGDPSDFALESVSQTTPLDTTGTSRQRAESSALEPVPSTVMYDSKALAEEFQRSKPPVDELYNSEQLSEAAKRHQQRHSSSSVSASLSSVPPEPSPVLRAPSRRTVEHQRLRPDSSIPSSSSYAPLEEEDASLSEVVSLGLELHSSPPRESVYQMTPLEAPSFLMHDGRLLREETGTLDDDELPETHDSHVRTTYDSVAPEQEALKAEVLDHWGVPVHASDPTPVEIATVNALLEQKAVTSDEEATLAFQGKRKRSFWRKMRDEAVEIEALEELELLIASAESEPESFYRLETLVHLHSQAVTLSWKYEEDTPEFVARIRRLANLREEIELASPLLGLLLNNISVMMYEAIHFKKDMPPSWERLLGFVPIEEMELWLEWTEEQASEGGRLREIRQQLRETMTYCKLVEASLEAWEKGLTS